MTNTEIRAEIDRLTEIVRYSPSKQANVAAMEIVKLQRKLDHMDATK